MDSTAIGVVGGVVGAVAVVVSSAYRFRFGSNTDAARSKTLQSAIDRVAAVNSRTSDADVAEALARGEGKYATGS